MAIKENVGPEYFSIIGQLFHFCFLPLGVEEPQHFEFRAWLAPPVLLPLRLPAFSTADQVLAEVRNVVTYVHISWKCLRNIYTVHVLHAFQCMHVIFTHDSLHMFSVLVWPF